MPAHATAMTIDPTAVRAMDPRGLLIAAVLMVIASLATVRTMTGMAALFGFVVIWHMAVANPAGAIRTLRRVAPLAVVIILNALLVPGEALVSVAGHRVASRPGLRDGLFFSLRLGVMLMAVSGLLAGSRAEGLALGIHDLTRRVSRPLADRIAFFTFLSAGFAPLFIDEIQRVRMAQAFRGGNANRGLAHRAGAVRMWLIPVLMSAVRRSGQLALAVELRDTRTRLIPSMPGLKFRIGDLVWLMLAMGVIVFASMS
jgi:energy-coupling factor transporter transmembrane protein EcfT